MFVGKLINLQYPINYMYFREEKLFFNIECID